MNLSYELKQIAKNYNDMLTASECLITYGLDWDVVTEPVTIRGKQSKRFKAVIREDTGYEFNVAGSDYEPIQNRTVFRFLDEFVQSGYAKYVKAASFNHGAVVCIVAKLPYDFEVTAGDEIATYLIAYTSHDSSRCLSVAPYILRQVCSNGMTAFCEDATRRVSVKHTANYETRFRLNAENVLTREIEYFKRFRESAVDMVKTPMPDSEFEIFLQTLFKVDASKEVSTRQTNILQNVRELWQAGRGSDIQGVRGTRWQAYNAVTEYIDHFRSTGGTEQSERQNNRQYASLFGAGKQLRERAYQILTN